jgi:uracil phosphoribosyltransferase
VMADAVAEQLLPGAPMGHIGLYRDHSTHQPVEYLCKLPEDAPGRVFIIVDPMLATGGSLAYAVNLVCQHGIAAERIRVMALVAAPEGVEFMAKAHPNVLIYTAALDEKLNENAYIVPGLGDAGDRLFGTK